MRTTLDGTRGNLNGRDHLAIGAGSTAAVLWGLSAAGLPMEPATIGIGALVAGLGALMPDIDHPRSTASSTLPRKLLSEALGIAVPLVALMAFFAFIGGKAAGATMLAAFAPLIKFAIGMAVFGGVFLGLSALVRARTGHRGATHSLVFAAGATVVVCIGCALFEVPAWYGLLFGWGWLTHLAADATTHMGLPSLLWPLGQPAAEAAVLGVGTATAASVPLTPQSTTPPVASAGESVAPACPSCGAPMVERVARRGTHAGERFYGCSNYPRCKHMMQIG